MTGPQSAPRSPPLTVRAATLAAAPVLAAIHETAFPHPWPAAEIASLLCLPGSFALTASLDDAPAGFVLVRSGGDEAEVLTIAVTPDCRRIGVGRTLLAHALDRLGAAGVGRLILEVAEDNPAARGLYAAVGFTEIGRRPRYYRSGADALVLAAATRASRP